MSIQKTNGRHTVKLTAEEWGILERAGVGPEVLTTTEWYGPEIALLRAQMMTQLSVAC